MFTCTLAFVLACLATALGALGATYVLNNAKGAANTTIQHVLNHWRLAEHRMLPWARTRSSITCSVHLHRAPPRSPALAW